MLPLRCIPDPGGRFMGSPDDEWEHWNADSAEEQISQTLYTEMCKALGGALCNWQHVERAHFRLFLKMLNAPNWETCSAAYYSIESFEARHNMVGRVAYYFLKDDRYKSQREWWCGVGGGLQKEIKTANQNRNKIAHYGLSFVEIKPMMHRVVDDRIMEPDGYVKFRFPALRPTPENLVDRLVGRISTNPEHSLGPGRINTYAHQFIRLAQIIGEFEASIKLADALPHESDPAPEPARPQGRKSRQSPSPRKSQPTDDQPSD
jgi:hypothetical protein